MPGLDVAVFIEEAAARQRLVAADAARLEIAAGVVVTTDGDPAVSAPRRPRHATRSRALARMTAPDDGRSLPVEGTDPAGRRRAHVSITPGADGHGALPLPDPQPPLLRCGGQGGEVADGAGARHRAASACLAR